MPKNPHADFTPTLAGYSGITPFRFWCQTALPLTYDDSLSYYELLNKVVNYLNHTIEDLTNVENNTSELAEAYEKLQKYVNDYFDDIDIEAELRNVLDGMAEDGTLDALLDPLVANRLPGVVEEQIDGAVAEQIDDAVEGQIDGVVEQQLPALVDANIGEEVSQWLEDNVDPVGSAVLVDSTLTISGAAADAKVTGDKINNLKAQTGDIIDNIPENEIAITAQNKTHSYWAIENGKATQKTSSGSYYSFDPIAVLPGEHYSGSINFGTTTSTQPVLVTDNEYNVIESVPALTSGSGYIDFDLYIPATGAYMMATKLGNTTDYTITKHEMLKVAGKAYVDEQVAALNEDIDEQYGALNEDIDELEEHTELLVNTIRNTRISPVGITWDWWYTSSVSDKYGTAYIGYIAENSKCGIMMHKTDGNIFYKDLDTALNNDDHNPMGVAIDGDGYVWAFGTLGHSYSNKIAVYKAQSPFTIDCDFVDLSYTIPEPTNITYKCTYAQVFIYKDPVSNIEYITDFFRCVSTNGVCYGAIQSTDGGETWVLHGVTKYTDPYIKIVDCGNGKLGLVCVSNPRTVTRTVNLGFIDIKTGAITDENGNSIASWSTPSGSTELWNSCTNNAREDFPVYHQPYDASRRQRLLDARWVSNKIYLLMAVADSGSLDYTYYLYNGINDIQLGKSGLPFYLFSSYLPGMCFLNDNLIAICRNESGISDGTHSMYVYDIAGAIYNKRAIFEHMGCRPIPAGNNKIAVSVGVYNDISTVSESGSFTQWKLNAQFVDIY